LTAFGACVALSAVVSLPAARADDTVNSPPVIVTGTVSPRTQGSEIGATSVLNRADLQRAGARDLAEALSLLGTAQVERLGGPGTAAVVRLRGADSRDTLVLVDGAPLTDVTTGQASWSQIATDSIERIEVVRGNLSALYGANATGGVVQIFTRQGKAGFGAEVRLGGGSRGTAWAGASLNGGSENLNARLTLGFERTTGFSAGIAGPGSTANPDADGNRRANANLAVDWQPLAGQRLKLGLRSLAGRTAYDSVDAYSSPADVHEARIVQQGATLSGQHALAGHWALSWRVDGSGETRHDRIVSAAWGESTFGNALHQRGAMAQVDFRPVDGATLQAAAEQLTQSTDNPTYLRNRRRTDVARLGASWDLGPWSLQANWRRDQTDDFGAADSHLLAAGWDLGGGLRLIGSWSTSFTPPTLDFLFYDCSPYPACSNPALRPERARNAELGLRWQSGETLLRATAFAARYRDKIANDADFVPQNVGRARNRGVELAAQGRSGAWRWHAEATFQNPVDEIAHTRLNRRAREQLALRLDRDLDAGSVGAALRQTGDRRDGDQRLAAYQVVDISANGNLAPGWQLQARVDNLFAAAWQPSYGYRGTPRGVYLGLAWHAGP
jgi:vitamin B12 transporter